MKRRRRKPAPRVPIFWSTAGYVALLGAVAAIAMMLTMGGHHAAQ